MRKGIATKMSFSGKSALLISSRYESTHIKQRGILWLSRIKRPKSKNHHSSCRENHIEFIPKDRLEQNSDKPKIPLEIQEIR